MGREMDSRQHFDLLKVHQEKGTKKMIYVIGGPLGLSGEVLNRAPMVLSLSRMTLNHEMSSLVLLEQLYRYLNFAAGEKYHK
jgi:23S rRNA (pseudouridine1915-N3)-methyltransferase